MISRTKAMSLLVAIITSAISALPIAFASTDMIENAQDCYDTGYEDEREFPFDHGAYDICTQFTDDQGNPYYSGFIYGCISVLGNTMDACELATD